MPEAAISALCPVSALPLPPSSSVPKRKHRQTTHSLTRALRVVFHTGGFFITVTIMGRKAAQALFHIHSSMWVTFGFWLIAACLVCKAWFSVNSSIT